MKITCSHCNGIGHRPYPAGAIVNIKKFDSIHKPPTMVCDCSNGLQEIPFRHWLVLKLYDRIHSVLKQYGRG